MLKLLNIKSEHDALYVINRLEAAVFSWKETITENASGKSPIRTSWSSFVKDPIAELDRAELLSERAEFLVQQLKTRFPNLPQTFLDATKVQYGKVSFTNMAFILYAVFLLLNGHSSFVFSLLAKF